jgi:hypothetical protein
VRSGEAQVGFMLQRKINVTGSGGGLAVRMDCSTGRVVDCCQPPLPAGVRLAAARVPAP